MHTLGGLISDGKTPKGKEKPEISLPFFGSLAQLVRAPGS